MNSKILAAALSVVLYASAAFAQGASDRVGSRAEDSRSRAEGRFHMIQQNQGGPEEQTIIKREVITEPVKKRAAKKGVQSPALVGEKPVKPKTKVIIRRETVRKPAPLLLNPY